MVRIRSQYRWRADCDYIKRLPDAEQAYIVKFLEEYYGEKFEDNPIHDEEQRRSLMRARNQQKLDIVTATQRAVQKRLNEISAMTKPRNYYSPEDYQHGRRESDTE